VARKHKENLLGAHWHKKQNYRRGVFKMKKLLAAVLVLVAALAAHAASERWQPTGNITALVGQAVGGGMDAMNRMVIPGLQKELGVNLVPTNVTGANAAIAIGQLMSNPPNGYTLFALSSASLTFPASALSDYDSRHFQMIAVAQATNPVISVPANSPFTTMEEWIDAIRAGYTTASNSGLGGIWHLPQLVIVNAIGGSATYIAYDGGRPAVMAAAQGEVDWSMSDLGEAMSLIQEGLVRPLAVHSVNDIYLEGYGNIPSILNWLPEIEEYIPLTNGFRGFALRRGTPQNIVDTWIEALRVVLNSAEVVGAAEGMSVTPLAIFGEEAEAMTEAATSYGSWLLYDMGYAERSPADVGLARR